MAGSLSTTTTRIVDCKPGIGIYGKAELLCYGDEAHTMEILDMKAGVVRPIVASDCETLAKTRDADAFLIDARNHPCKIDTSMPAVGNSDWDKIDQHIKDETARIKAESAAHDAEAAQGWCPAVLDTNGDGRITEWTEPNAPVDPAKDHPLTVSSGWSSATARAMPAASSVCTIGPIPL